MIKCPKECKGCESGDPQVQGCMSFAQGTKIIVIGWIGKRTFRELKLTLSGDPIFPPAIYKVVGDPCDWALGEYPPVKVELTIEEVK